jgi:Concanavalin A-like lectin/glucanases superfamily/Calcineurin-like phosphoesterase
VTGSNAAGSATAVSDATPVVAEPPDPVIGAAGDIACDPASPFFNGGLGTASACRKLATSNLLVGSDLTAVLPLGDVQYECGSYSTFLQSYDPSWGRLKAITRPVIGNNEYHVAGGSDCDATGAAAGYFDYFGAAAGERTKAYYSYDLGRWHLIALNTNCSKAGGCAPGSAQEQWLRQDLAASAADCTLAYWHHPRFSSGGSRPGDGEVAALFRALYDHGADVVLAGHDHHYERFAPQDPSGGLDLAMGIRTFVVGTGGSNLHRLGLPVGNSEFRNDSAFGVLKLTLQPGGHDWEFVSESGAILDSGSDSCDGTAPDTQAPARPANLSPSGARGNQVTLGWTPSGDDVGVISYELYRDGELLVRTTSPVQAYVDTSVVPATSYSYHVTARDAAGNVSAASDTASVYTGPTPYDVVIDADAPVGHWKLGDDPSGPYWDRIAGRNGTQSGGVPPIAGGVLGNAGDRASSFDGVDDKVTVRDDNAFDFGNTFTLEAWVKRSGLGSRTFLFKGDGSWVLLSNASNRIVLRRSTVADIVSSTTTLTDTASWHHVVATKEGPAAKIYIDGVDVSGPVTDQTLVDNNLPLTIGLSGNVTYWSGGIDEVAVYNTALSAERVLAHYRAGT